MLKALVRYFDSATENSLDQIWVTFVFIFYENLRITRFELSEGKAIIVIIVIIVIIIIIIIIFIFKVKGVCI